MLLRFVLRFDGWSFYGLSSYHIIASSYFSNPDLLNHCFFPLHLSTSHLYKTSKHCEQAFLPRTAFYRDKSSDLSKYPSSRHSIQQEVNF